MAKQLTTWTLYQKSTASIIKRNQNLPTADGSIPDDLDPDLAWLSEWLDDEPQFDANTERIESDEMIEVAGNTGKRTLGFNVVALTNEQLQQKTSNAKLATLESKIRKIGKKLKSDTPITSEETYTAIKYFFERDGLS